MTTPAAAKRPPARRKVAEALPEDIETVRAGIRPVLLEKFRISILENRKRAAVAADWKPGPTEADTIAAFEDALYDKALGIWRASGPRGEPFKYVYVKVAVSAALKALGAPIGPFPDSSLAVALIRRDVAPADAAADDVLYAHREDTPRQVCKRLLLRSLLKDGTLAEDRERALALASAIEASCFRAVIQQCKLTESPFRRCWESEQFVALYSARCGTVNSHIDADSSVCRVYGAGLLFRLLADEGSADALSADALGTMTAAEMCPAATEHERAEIDLRSQQHVAEKPSDLFQCPVPTCRARKCTYREVQTRSLDEPASIYCRCLECGHRFRGA